MSSNQGAAREVEPGRLKDFEADDLPDVTSLTLPPRRRRHAPTVGADDVVTVTPQPTEVPAVSPEPVTPAASEEPAPKPRRRPAEKAASTAAADDETAPATKGPEQRVRPSNVHIPVWLVEPIAEKHTAEGLSNGEIIISAIERAYPRLKDLIHPVTVSGGSLFASRRSRTSRAGDGPLTPLNYRMREEDFSTLDHLVEELNASSRGHLITVALTDFFGPTN
ncbi:MAG: hypothetical protein L0H79_21415 [Intrasporangium sp.]|uniref:hypothetical protein n=1 Tax=Intrasporangium sp. TaxID=1925024 RepID=UPI00264A4D49|nr:hypothetical protein [Intrasporangium sp.]MDN5798287.1 hypothetical protein [Intrasporangium sp.]